MAMPSRRACLQMTAATVAVGLTSSRAAHARAVQTFETAAGIKVWLVEESAIPLVSVRFSFLGGALHDPAGREGLASLTAALLSEGAGKLDSEAFARRLADEGSQLAFSGTRDRISGGVDALSGRLAASFELLSMAAAEPRFEAGAVDRVRDQRLADLEVAANEARRVAFERWWAATFPNDARGRPSEGTPQSIAAIRREDIVGQHRSLLTRDALRVVVVGAVGRGEAAALIDHAFARLPRTAADRSTVTLGQPRRMPTPLVTELPSAVATTAFGTPIPDVRDPEYPALRLLAQVIGSGDFDSTLMQEIRVKRGLAYAVSTSLIADGSASVLLGGMATQPERQPEAFALLRRILAEVAAEGPLAEPVEAARSHLLGSAPLDVDSNAKLAGFLLKAWHEGRGPDAALERRRELESVTVEDVRRVAGKWLQPDGLNYVIVAPRS